MNEIAKFQREKAAKLAPWGCTLGSATSISQISTALAPVIKLVETAAREAFASGVLFAQQELDPRGGEGE